MDLKLGLVLATYVASCLAPLSDYKCINDLDGADDEDVIRDIKDLGVSTFGERMKGGAKAFIRKV